MTALLILVAWALFIGVFIGLGDWFAERRNEKARLNLGCSEVQREAERLARQHIYSQPDRRDAS